MAVQVRDHNLGEYIVPKDAFKGICIDIGCNVGSFLKEYGHKFQEYHFYEPQPECYQRCVSINSNAQGFQEAVYSCDGEMLPIVEHANGDSGSVALKTEVLNSDWTDAEICNVRTVSFATVIKRAGGGKSTI